MTEVEEKFNEIMLYPKAGPTNIDRFENMAIGILTFYILFLLIIHRKGRK